MSPKVSIGLPVYNGRGAIREVIEALLNQSFSDFELIISDNASSDGTEGVCRELSIKDSRIRYIRQPCNIGPAENFKFVLGQAQGVYYMWAASDDFRSPDFLSLNVLFLDEHPEYVASTCPNCFEGDELDPEKIVRFAMDGELKERYLTFLQHCWESHGIFYSLMRTKVIKDCGTLGQSFTAADWAIDLFMASRGQIHRTESGLAIFGRDGVSSRAGAWRVFRQQPIECIFPFWRFTLHALVLMKSLSGRSWLQVFIALLKLNMKASLNQMHAAMYEIYCRFFR